MEIINSILPKLNVGQLSTDSNDFIKVDVGLGLKTGYLHSNFIDNHYFEDPYTNPNSPNNVLYKDDILLVEPMAFFRFGGERLKIKIQGGITAGYQFTHKNQDIPFETFNIGVSLNWRLHKK